MSNMSNIFKLAFKSNRHVPAKPILVPAHKSKAKPAPVKTKSCGDAGQDCNTNKDCCDGFACIDSKCNNACSQSKINCKDNDGSEQDCTNSYPNCVYDAGAKVCFDSKQLCEGKNPHKTKAECDNINNLNKQTGVLKDLNMCRYNNYYKTCTSVCSPQQPTPKPAPTIHCMYQKCDEKTPCCKGFSCDEGECFRDFPTPPPPPTPAPTKPPTPASPTPKPAPTKNCSGAWQPCSANKDCCDGFTCDEGKCIKAFPTPAPLHCPIDNIACKENDLNEQACLSDFPKCVWDGGAGGGLCIPSTGLCAGLPPGNKSTKTQDQCDNINNFNKKTPADQNICKYNIDKQTCTAVCNDCVLADTPEQCTAISKDFCFWSTKDKKCNDNKCALADTSDKCIAMLNIKGESNPYSCFWNKKDKKCEISCDYHINEYNCNSDKNCNYDYRNNKCIFNNCSLADTPDKCNAMSKDSCFWNHNDKKCIVSCDTYINDKQCNSDKNCIYDNTNNKCWNKDCGLADTPEQCTGPPNHFPFPTPAPYCFWNNKDKKCEVSCHTHSNETLCNSDKNCNYDYRTKKCMKGCGLADTLDLCNAISTDFCFWSNNDKKCVLSCDTYINDNLCNSDKNCKYDYRNNKCMKDCGLADTQDQCTALSKDFCFWSNKDKKCEVSCDTYINDNLCNSDKNCKYDYKNNNCIFNNCSLADTPDKCIAMSKEKGESNPFSCFWNNNDKKCIVSCDTYINDKHCNSDINCNYDKINKKCEVNDCGLADTLDQCIAISNDVCFWSPYDNKCESIKIINFCNTYIDEKHCNNDKNCNYDKINKKCKQQWDWPDNTKEKLPQPNPQYHTYWPPATIPEPIILTGTECDPYSDEKLCNNDKNCQWTNVGSYGEKCIAKKNKIYKWCFDSGSTTHNALPAGKYININSNDKGNDACMIDDKKQDILGKMCVQPGTTNTMVACSQSPNQCAADVSKYCEKFKGEWIPKGVQVPPNADKRDPRMWLLPVSDPGYQTCGRCT